VTAASTANRAQFAAALRAIADLVERDETLRVPGVRVDWFVSDAPDQAAALQAVAGAVPLEWAGKVSHGSGRTRDWYELTGSTAGTDTMAGLMVVVNAYASAVCTEAGTRTVTEWAPVPAVAALTERPGGAS
jgi:hypothetical protein